MKAMQRLYAHGARDDGSMHTHDQWKKKFHQKPLHI